MRKVALAAFVAYSALLVFSSPAQSLPDCKDGPVRYEVQSRYQSAGADAEAARTRPLTPVSGAGAGS